MTTKHDSGKWRFSLVPFEALRSIIAVLEFGAQKYAPDNWKTVPDARTRYYDAAMRHLTAWFSGEKLDQESGESHLAHAACCIMFLLWFDTQVDPNAVLTIPEGYVEVPYDQVHGFNVTGYDFLTIGSGAKSRLFVKRRDARAND